MCLKRLLIVPASWAVNSAAYSIPYVVTCGAATTNTRLYSRHNSHSRFYREVPKIARRLTTIQFAFQWQREGEYSCAIP